MEPTLKCCYRQMRDELEQQIGYRGKTGTCTKWRKADGLVADGVSVHKRIPKIPKRIAAGLSAGALQKRNPKIQ